MSTLQSKDELIMVVECECTDPDHYIRFHYDKESWGNGSEPSLYLYYGVGNFPGDGVDSGPIGGAGSQWKYRWNHIKYFFKKKACYLSNIWSAIKGKPLWFRGHVDMNPEDVRDVQEYLDKYYPRDKARKRK